MDWKIVFTTLSAIFVAELADKTQLVGMSLAAESKKPLSVLVGSVSGYILVTAISIFIGTLLGKYIRPEIIRYTGAVIFILIGTLMLWGKI